MWGTAKICAQRRVWLPHLLVQHELQVLQQSTPIWSSFANHKCMLQAKAAGASPSVLSQAAAQASAVAQTVRQHLICGRACFPQLAVGAASATQLAKPTCHTTALLQVNPAAAQAIAQGAAQAGIPAVPTTGSAPGVAPAAVLPVAVAPVAPTIVAPGPTAIASGGRRLLLAA